MMLEMDRLLALAWAPAKERSVFKALFDLDDALWQNLLRAREPQLARIRLAWWREQLEPGRMAAPAADPVLQAVAAIRARLPGSGHVPDMADGWAALLDQDADGWAEDHAELRGQGLFQAVCHDDHAALAGRAWGLARVALDHLAPDQAQDIAIAAQAALAAMDRASLRRKSRPLAVLCALARADIDRLLAGKGAAGPARRIGIAGRVALFAH